MKDAFLSTHSYDDLLGLPHHVSSRRPPMPRAMRAAQFAPFAALTGYDAAVQETARLTDRKPELDDDQKLLLNGKLQLIQDNLRTLPQVTFTCFQPDERKQGGQILTVTGRVKKIDSYERCILLVGGKRILIDDVLAIEGEALDEWPFQ